MRAPCKTCPWVDRDDEMNTLEDKISGRKFVTQILAKNGVSGQPHACHMLTTEMMPACEDEICQGHLNYLQSK